MNSKHSPVASPGIARRLMSNPEWAPSVSFGVVAAADGLAKELICNIAAYYRAPDPYRCADDILENLRNLAELYRESRRDGGAE